MTLKFYIVESTLKVSKKQTKIYLCYTFNLIILNVPVCYSGSLKISIFEILSIVFTLYTVLETYLQQAYLYIEKKQYLISRNKENDNPLKAKKPTSTIV
jgi:hypothetical protein